MKGLLVAVAALAVAGAARADDWVSRLGLVAHGIAVDKTLLTRRGDRVSFWVAALAREGDTSNGIKVRYQLAQFEFDCQRRTSLILSSTEYGFNENSIGTISAPPGTSADPIPPESQGSDLFGLVCETTPADYMALHGDLKNVIAGLEALRADMKAKHISR